MTTIGVGVIGASAVRPGWATTAHLPALTALPDFALRAVATSSMASAQAAEDLFGVPGFADPAELIDRPNVDLVVVTVKLPHHFDLVSAAIDAGKMVMCEWPLGLALSQTERLAIRAREAGVASLIGLQARMAPTIRYARDLVQQGFVGEVLATTLVGSGIGWGPVTDRAHAYIYDAASGVSTLSVPAMHALDALCFVLGDLVDVRAATAVRRPLIRLSDSDDAIVATAPDHVALSATLASGAIASVFYRGGVSRGDNLRWEINGSEGDLVLTSSLGNLQVLDPILEGGRGEEGDVKRLTVPTSYDLAPVGLQGPAANVARLYAGFAERLREHPSEPVTPDFDHAARLHRCLHAIETAAISGLVQSSLSTGARA